MVGRSPLPPEVKDIQVSSGTLDDGEEHILRLFSASGAGMALISSEWDIEEEIRHLVDLARTADTDSARLTAMRQLNQRVERIAELNGLVVKGSMHRKSQAADGSLVETVQTASRLISTIKQGLPNGRDSSSPYAGRTVRPLDSIPRDDSGDNRTGEVVDAP